MTTFYRHVRTNGHLKQDTRAGTFQDAKEACATAAHATPELLKRSIQPDGNAYVTTEVRDEDRAVCVVRGSIILENR